jgi:hypothetical protein
MCGTVEAGAGTGAEGMGHVLLLRLCFQSGMAVATEGINFLVSIFIVCALVAQAFVTPCTDFNIIEVNSLDRDAAFTAVGNRSHLFFSLLSPLSDSCRLRLREEQQWVRMQLLFGVNQDENCS